ncbi:CPBP family intramembrane glutamic endopeptidase [Rhodanobacter ginsengisoli]|uniref:CPBP family intramembrane glutamic endopeptidase n=1 Tax=Rhodanobacter ginsengisoli TaxID=418646 RepID=A0ABW0QRX8_9GAMM
MHDPSIAFITPARAPAWKRWLLFSPLARIVIFVALFLLTGFVIGFLSSVLGWGTKSTTLLQHPLGLLIGRALPAIVAYLLLAGLVERRSPSELTPNKLLPYGAAGLLLGTVLFSAVVGMLYLLGSYHVTGFNPDPPWLPELLVYGLAAGISEEILFRGVLYRIVEEGLGTWAALIVSALFFGVAHIFNPGATLWSSVAIAIEAGLLFGLLYHVTRSLYLCMGVHAAWNFAQGTIYGIPVSGLKADGWLLSTRTGPRWLSGGIFGAEASVIALVLCLLCSTALLVIALRRRTIVPPLASRHVAASGTLLSSLQPCG